MAWTQQQKGKQCKLQRHDTVDRTPTVISLSQQGYRLLSDLLLGLGSGVSFSYPVLAIHIGVDHSNPQYFRVPPTTLVCAEV